MNGNMFPLQTNLEICGFQYIVGAEIDPVVVIQPENFKRGFFILFIYFFYVDRDK